MNKKILIFAIIGLIFTVIMITLIFNNRMTKDNNEPFHSNLNNDVSTTKDFTDEQIVECWNKIEDSLVGKWLYLGGFDSEEEYNKAPFLILNKDNSFVANGWGGDGVGKDGDWNYEYPHLILDFNDDNTFWNNENEEEFNQYFPEYNFNEKTNTISVELGYKERIEDFTGECQNERYYINIMNYYLYREEYFNSTPTVHQ